MKPFKWKRIFGCWNSPVEGSNFYAVKQSNIMKILYRFFFREVNQLEKELPITKKFITVEKFKLNTYLFQENIFIPVHFNRKIDKIIEMHTLVK